MFGSIVDPWLAGIFAESAEEFYKAYGLVIVVGLLAVLASLFLPKHTTVSEQKTMNLIPAMTVLYSIWVVWLDCLGI